MTENITHIFSLGTILLQVGIVLVLLAYVTRKKLKISNTLLQHARSWFTRYGLHVGFGAALIALLGSLYYSEIAGYTPCTLCWYQRIFMYSQVVLFGLALVRNEWVIRPYVVLLSFVGALIALFHYTEQVSSNPLAPCSVVGYASSCAEYFVMSYGYITIPMMALTLFGVILISMWFGKKQM